MSNGGQDNDIELGWPAAEIQIEVDPRTPLSSRERADRQSDDARSAALRAARRKALSVAFLVLLAVGGLVLAQLSVSTNVTTMFKLTLFASLSSPIHLIVYEIVGIMQHEGPDGRFSGVRMIIMLLKLLGNVCGSIVPLMAVSLEKYGGNKVSEAIGQHRFMFYYCWMSAWLIVFSVVLGKERMPDSRKLCFAF